MNKNTDGSSQDVVADNIAQLKLIFPEVFSEGKIDFEVLKATLGDYLETQEERYQFNWNGKSQARRIAQTQSTGTLRPCKEESKNWNTTQNIFIEGDNLEVLKLLQKSYHKKVKMIYIDPPYNTGKEFIYPDNFKANLDTYLEYTGQIDGEGRKFGTNAETTGRYHTNWLNMMYPRLKLARNLLADDGVIFISIDDNEQANLKKLCDEVFGEESFICSFMWKRKKEISSDSRNASIQGEYVISFSKSNDCNFMLESLSEKYIEKSYKEPIDDYPLGKWRPVPITVSKGLSGGGYNYQITTPNGKIHERLWAYPEKSFRELEKKNRIYWGVDKLGIPQRIMYAHESNGQPTTNYWDNTASNKDGKKTVLSLFEGNYFDTPKPLGLVQRLSNLIVKNGDLVLDFFSGSCTTAHAIMDLNAQDNGKRKHIMVQLPEPCDEKSEAYKAGYKTIADIGKERIRRAGEKILVKNKDKDGIENLDIGFKVFKLDSSNIKAWDADFDNLEDDLISAIENTKVDRSEDDLLYEILLKYGLDLTIPIETHTFYDKTVYSIGSGTLIICLDNNITLDVVEAMGKLKQELQPDTCHVVFKDNGFKDDVVKTNAIQVLKQYQIEDVKSL